jgi:hypothetical protein
MVFGFKFITGQAGTQKEWLDVTFTAPKNQRDKNKKSKLKSLRPITKLENLTIKGLESGERVF